MQTPTAFAAPAAVASASQLLGARLACPAAATASTPVTMALSRRAALSVGLGALGAALLGAGSPVLAKSGEGAKISVFGVGGASSPFVSGISKSGQVLYTPFSDEEQNYFKGIVEGSAERLTGAKTSIDGKSWEDIRSAIRLEMTLLRQTAVTINSNLRLSDPKKADTADKIFAQFKKNVNALDYACVLKDQDKALKSYKATIKDFAGWREVVGV
jgi:hypothetical protein